MLMDIYKKASRGFKEPIRIRSEVVASGGCQAKSVGLQSILKVKNVGGRTKRNTLSGGILRVASYLGNQDIAVRLITSTRADAEFSELRAAVKPHHLLLMTYDTVILRKKTPSQACVC